MENPSYYSILIAEVRYDKDLKANEKLLYSEISALTNKNGYCSAGNVYFSKLYDVHKDTISEWINRLKEKNYITTKVIRKGKKIAERRIYLSHEDSCRQKDLELIGENTYKGIGENTLDNNTSINNINNNIYSRIIDSLNSLAGTSYRSTIKKTQDLIKARLNEKFKEEDFLKVINIKTKEWKRNYYAKVFKTRNIIWKQI